MSTAVLIGGYGSAAASDDQWYEFVPACEELHVVVLVTVASTYAVALRGIDGVLVEVQADIANGLPGLSFTGLGDTAVVEARDRIRSAISNSGAKWPDRKITLALLPADVRKAGSRFDLAMALAVLCAAGTVNQKMLTGTTWIAELGLDGKLRPVRGVLPAVLAAREAGMRHIVVAVGNGAEAALVSGIDVRVANTLAELVHWLREGTDLPQLEYPQVVGAAGAELADLAEVAGQAAAKRALEVSAAGEHHLYLVGAPGSGKTMLAERLPGILPELDDEAALEVSAVHSVTGQFSAQRGLIRRAPFQAPHHNASVAALVGGGPGLATPGAISLAHRGVLFLDEAPQFAPSVLDALRQPVESGHITLHRSGGVLTYPCRFLLVLAANPCPCGARAQQCTCAPQARRRYLQRLSGPLLDRVDVRVYVDPVPRATLLRDDDPRESSHTVAARVASARGAARVRWSELGYHVNSAVPGSVLRSARWRLDRRALTTAESYLERGTLSARGFDRVLRLAWTVADLAGHVVPNAGDVSEALYLRTGVSSGWAA